MVRKLRKNLPQKNKNDIIFIQRVAYGVSPVELLVSLVRGDKHV